MSTRDSVRASLARHGARDVVAGKARHGNPQHSAVIPPVVHEVLDSPGTPLARDDRALFESRLGHDLSHVRVHTDPRAAQSAEAVGAAAYTVGNDIVFGPNQFSRQSASGRSLLAHELTHTIQQRHASHSRVTAVGEQGGAAEYEATEIANAVGSSSAVPPSIMTTSSSPCLQRQEATGGKDDASSWNLVAVGWCATDYLDDAFVEQIERVKQEFENIDEEKLRSLAQAAVLRLLARFVPGVGVAVLMHDLGELGMEALQTLKEALHADTDEERMKVAKVIAGILVAWAISRVIGKLGKLIRKKWKGRTQKESDFEANPPKNDSREPLPHAETPESSSLQSKDGSAGSVAVNQNARTTLLHRATDARVKNEVSELYRDRQGKPVVGSGSTADGLRYEIRTGHRLSKAGHWTKAEQKRTRLLRLLRDGSLNAEDKAIVKKLLIDLQDALSHEGPHRMNFDVPKIRVTPIELPPVPD